MIFYQVAVAAPINNALTYSHPVGQQEILLPGIRVLVPLGRRYVTGYILSSETRSKELTSEFKIKPIWDVLDPEPIFPSQLIPFYTWVADYYHHPIGEVVKTALPGGLSPKSSRSINLVTEKTAEILQHVENSKQKKSSWLDSFIEKGELSKTDAMKAWRNAASRKKLIKWQEKGWVQITHEITGSKNRNKIDVFFKIAQQYQGNLLDNKQSAEEVLSKFLENFPDLKKSEQKTLQVFIDLCRQENVIALCRPVITRQYSGARKGLLSLSDMGILVMEERRVYRDPFGSHPTTYSRPEILTEEQDSVLSTLYPAIQEQKFQTFLLHGVTGCGKTEIYMQAAEKALAEKKTVLVLVPEIALSTQLESHFYSRFGDILAVLHSGLSTEQKYDQWQRILHDKAHVVIGARSSIFAPLSNLGLIIVDEEHEPAYKQDSGLRYNGRDLAVLRARFFNCPVVLGSATPTVTSYYHASTGKYKLLSMKKRVHDIPFPEVEIVNLGKDKKRRPGMFFSDKLVSSLRENLKMKQQSLLFVNRRGYAGFMLCRACGHIVDCKHCQVSLTYHKKQQKLVCHYCAYSISSKIVCPKCRSDKIDGMGIGSERIEEEVRLLFPQARIARLDSDTTVNQKSYLAILQAVRNREIDILIGTQMIAKGLHFPGVTLVGIVWAESGLGIPDFKASERTFQLLSQVTGRAGRGEEKGRVIIQTYQPDHYTIQFAKLHDYQLLFDQELQFRQQLNYPPFSRLVNIRISGGDEVKVKQSAKSISAFIRSKVAAKPGIELLGPAPSPLYKISNQIRWQMLLKSKQPALIHDLISELEKHRTKLCPGELKMIIDVDPENML